MNGECNATNVQGKNYNLHKLQGGHVPQCPIAGVATVAVGELWHLVSELNPRLGGLVNRAYITA